jgi:hypothetical protein
VEVCKVVCALLARARLLVLFGPRGDIPERYSRDIRLCERLRLRALTLRISVLPRKILGQYAWFCCITRETSMVIRGQRSARKRSILLLHR